MRLERASDHVLTFFTSPPLEESSSVINAIIIAVIVDANRVKFSRVYIIYNVIQLLFERCTLHWTDCCSIVLLRRIRRVFLGSTRSRFDRASNYTLWNKLHRIPRGVLTP